MRSWNGVEAGVVAVSSSAVCTNMHRILQRRRVRKLRVVWASLALVALSLAACSALFTAWTWRQTRDLSQSFKILQDRLEQVCSVLKNQSPNSRYICTNNNISSPVTITDLQVFLILILWLRLQGIFTGGIWKNAIPHFTPFFPPSASTLYSTAQFLCLPLLLLTNKCSQVVWSYLFLCATPFLSAPPAMFNYSGASCAPGLSQFTGKPQLFGM